MSLSILYALVLAQSVSGDLPDPMATVPPESQAAVWQAIDQRDHNAAALQGLDNDTKGYALGMIGSQEACDMLANELPRYKTPAAGLIVGLALCRREGDAETIINGLNMREGENPSLPRMHWPLVGAHMSEAIRDYMVQKIAQETTPSVALIDGVMHSFAYTRPALTDLPPWDISGQIAALDALGSFEQQYAIRFALSRLKPLNDLPAVQAFAAKLLTEDLSSLSNDALDLRVFEIRSFEPGNALTTQVRDHILAKGPDRLRQEVLRFYSPNSEKDAGILLAIAGDTLEPNSLRAFAVGRFSGAKDLSAETLSEIESLIDANSEWLSVRALQVFSQFNPEGARTTAANWLKGASDYKVMKAASLLAGDETGSSFLRGVAAAQEDTSLKDLIETLLSDQEPSDTPNQPTPDFLDARSALGFIVTLDTTKGPIKIGFKASAPFAAYNFYRLAQDGLMDGMAFHRVIPNFVAQWGETLTKEAYSWHNIRDNWLYGWHRYGSVGVATAGKDTGSSQFFINLVHNRTLDHRYTVLGQVLEGMGIVESLEEGDHVIGAKLAPLESDDQSHLLDMLKPKIKPSN